MPVEANKYREKVISKTRKSRKYSRKYSGKHSINKSKKKSNKKQLINKYKSKQQKGGALPIEDLIAIIESELGRLLDNETKKYYKERYECFKTDDGKEKEFAKIIDEIQNQKRIESRLSNSRLNVGAAAAAAREPEIRRRLTRESSISGPISQGMFTIITTGLSNWGRENNIIAFYGIIMESLIMNTFFGKISRIQVHHYDSNLTTAQSELIKTTETAIKKNYDIQIESIIHDKDLEPLESHLQALGGIDSSNCFHLDFANLDEGREYTDSYLSINSVPIRKMYFGYWEPTYPPEYADIIKQIKLMEINPDKPITTFVDKLRVLDISIDKPGLFYQIPECEGIPRSVITIPGLRTMFQWGGLNAIELYKSLWKLSTEDMIRLIHRQQESLINNAFAELEKIRKDRISKPQQYCEFCRVRQCLETKFQLNDSRPHPRLCGLCFRLTPETIGAEMIKNTPPAR